MKTIGYIGLGKMGLNQVLLLKDKKIPVLAFNRSKEGRTLAKQKGVDVANTLEELVSKLKKPRVIWLMISHNGVDEMLKSLVPLLSSNDIIIDGGNCYFEDTVRRTKYLSKKGIRMLDAGVSGGPSGARKGACIMVGGNINIYKKLTPIFKALSAPNALLHAGENGAGHFVKMVHNGIEYGMMQALAEGFEIMKKSRYKLNLKEISRLYNNGSVIESRLVGWLENAFSEIGDGLKEASPTVAHTGEGEWTVKTAKKLGVPAKIIEESFKFRVESASKPSYSGRVLSALRNQFGGHKM